MRRLTDRLRGFVGKGASEESSSPEEGTTEVSPPHSRPAVSPAPPAAPMPQASTATTVEAAYAMLNAFPKDTEDSQRLPALRAALAATMEQKSKTLQQLLAEVLQEKARIASVLQTQDKNFDYQLLKITEAVDALWDKRDKLTEHHQRVTIEGKERLEGLDQLIQCLSTAEESAPSPVTLTSMTPPKLELVEEDEGPVVVRMPMMELRPLGEEHAVEPEPLVEPVEAPSSNPRKLYTRSAA
jgi:hypothetical protein